MKSTTELLGLAKARNGDCSDYRFFNVDAGLRVFWCSLHLIHCRASENRLTPMIAQRQVFVT